MRQSADAFLIHDASEHRQLSQRAGLKPVLAAMLLAIAWPAGGQTAGAAANGATDKSTVAVAETASNPSSAAAANESQSKDAHAKASPAFLVPQTRLHVGRSSVLTFKLAQPATQNQNWSAAVEPAGMVEVLREPAVLAGYDIGFLQVRPIKAGECTLRIGSATITLNVAPALINALEQQTDRPVVVSPSRGAAVWGTFTVGVEVNELNQQDDATPSADHVVLEVGTQRLKPVGSPQKLGPLRRYIFEVNANDQPAGVIELSAVVTSSDGSKVRSEATRLLCLKPEAGQVIEQECEATLGTARNENIGSERPRVGRDPAASGKRYVSSYSQNPAWAFSMTTQTPGSYQVMIVARGDVAAGAFPSIGLALNGEDRSTTGGRLVDAQWRRYAIGTPFYLDKGEHVIAAKFINDFYAEGLADRNLYLDRYEIMRVSEPTADDTTQDAGGMMMASKANSGAMMMKSSPSMMAAMKPKMMAMTPNMTPDTTPSMSMQAKPAMSSKAMSAAGMMGLYQDKTDAAAKVSFTRPVHGLAVRSDVTLKAQVWWPEPRENHPPRTTLLINGKPFDAQWDQSPIFHISTGHFKPGVNSVQLLTEIKDGGSGISPVQLINVPQEIAEEGYKRRYMRFAVADPAWASLPNGLMSPKYPQGRRFAVFATNSEAVLNLPDDMTGPYDVLLEAIGEEFQGLPIAQVSLRVGNNKTTDNDKTVGQIEVHKWLGERPVGKVELPAGPKQLVVTFTNDHYIEGKGDRNLSLGAVQLRQPQPDKNQDVSPPAVELLYPAEGQHVYDADAIVASAWDNNDIAWADIVIDGKPQELHLDLSDGLGKLVFPLLPRTLSPGKHRVKIRMRDQAQNMAESREVTINVLDTQPQQLTQYARAIRLLNRFAFGPDADELADILTMGETAWLKDRLGRTGSDLAEQAVTDLATVIYTDESYYGSIGQRVVKTLMTTANPARMRFVLWTQNHFSTWIRKTEAARKWEEHERFVRLGPAPFGELLLASATSPAMLIYLDQARSFAGSLNENYAREIMELHTLGVRAGYTQDDVTALANVLCGWTFSEETGPDGTTFPLYPTFRFDPAMSDGQPRQVFGMAFPQASVESPTARYDRVRLALEMLAAHPATARYIATKLAEHYVAIPAPKQLVDDLTVVYLSTGGDMQDMLIAIAQHPDFLAVDLAPKVARPIDYLARMFRTSNADDVWQAYLFLERSGMGMFDHITPDGYPEEDDNYADTNALLQRWRLAQTQQWRLSTFVPWQWKQPSKADPAAWRQRVVDLIAIRLTGMPLSGASNEAALDVFEKSTGSPDDRIQQLGPFIASLPEASLR